MRTNLTAAPLLAALAALLVAVGASAGTAAAPSNTSPPVVSGTAKVGHRGPSQETGVRELLCRSSGGDERIPQIQAGT